MLTSTVQLSILAHALQAKRQARLFGEIFRNESLSAIYIRPHNFFGSINHPTNSVNRVCGPKISSIGKCGKSANAEFAFIPAVGRPGIFQCAHDSSLRDFDDGCYARNPQLSPKVKFRSSHGGFSHYRSPTHGGLAS